MTTGGSKFVGRAGHKLDLALEAFALDVAGWLCADFGCNVGGFTDCLLQRGAAKVYALDTGYGALAWKLRKDPRVIVLERTNALYAPVAEPLDLVAIDVAWTPQKLIVPAAMAWLKPAACAVSLLKPHYELTKLQGRKPTAPLPIDQGRQVCQEVCRQLADLGCRVDKTCESTVTGKGGNTEFLLLVRKGVLP